MSIISLDFCSLARTHLVRARYFKQLAEIIDIHNKSIEFCQDTDDQQVQFYLHQAKVSRTQAKQALITYKKLRDRFFLHNRATSPLSVSLSGKDFLKWPEYWETFSPTFNNERRDIWTCRHL